MTFLGDQIQMYGLKVVETYNAVDYGPLNHHENWKKHASNFRGAKYCMVKANSKHGIIVHRLYDNIRAPEQGQYFTLEKRDGNFGAMLDLAVMPDWNKMSLSRSLWVPPNFLFFVGYAGPQQVSSYFLLGGGLQVFIPNVYLKYIFEAQTSDKSKQKIALTNGLIKQREFMKEYFREINRLCEEKLNWYTSNENSRRLTQHGNNINNLPVDFQLALQQLRGGKKISFKNHNDYPSGTYILHKERLHLPNGKQLYMQLSARIRYDGETKRVNISGNKKETIITHHYTILIQWLKNNA